MPHFHLLPYGTTTQQSTQGYALETTFLRINTTPAIPRLSNNQEEGSGTGVEGDVVDEGVGLLP